MSRSSPDFSDAIFADMTEDDFRRIDEGIEAAYEAMERPTNATNASAVEPHQALTDLEDLAIDKIPEADSSFGSDQFELHLGSLTEDDFARLDADMALKNASTAGPVHIELDDTGSSSTPGPSTRDPRPKGGRTPPITEFRLRNILSVTDLVGPSWCEVQYDYGLRGKRNRPLALRPKSFTTPSGNIVTAKKEVSEKNDVRTKQGRVMHKELEREVRGVTLQVDVPSEETRWGLRLVNLMSDLKVLMMNGARNFTREVAVFGIVQDQLVTGVIDEVIRETTVLPPNTAKRKKKTKTLETYFNENQSRAKRRSLGHTSSSPIELVTSAESSADESEQRTSTTLFIRDAKTRERKTLPRDEDATSGRFQLAIYRKLLVDLLQTDPPYDFRPIWERTHVDPSKTFPTKFLEQCGLMDESSGTFNLCLDDLVASWHRLVEVSKIDQVSKELQLTYYLRPSGGTGTRNRKGKGKDKPVRLQLSLNRTLEADEIDGIQSQLQRAIDQSYEEARQAPRHAEGSGPVSDTLDRSDEVRDAPDHDLALAIQRSLEEVSGTSTATTNPTENVLPASSQSMDVIRSFNVIGTKTFSYDEAALQEFVARVLQWWRGERDPEGVPPEKTYRCRMCEYENDCEWRSAKALEHTMRNQR